MREKERRGKRELTYNVRFMIVVFVKRGLSDVGYLHVLNIPPLSQSKRRTQSSFLNQIDIGKDLGSTYGISSNEAYGDARRSPVVRLRVVRHPRREEGREGVDARDGEEEGAVGDVF